MNTRLGLLLVAVVVAAIGANIALLSVATGSHERVGRLSPVVLGTARPSAPSIHIAPPPRPEVSEAEPDD